MCDPPSARACQFPGAHLPEGPRESQSQAAAGHGTEGGHQAHEAEQDQVCHHFPKL